uniref:Uncharacterized protein n=1 Tax=Arundo donax TaxID=35708 RepID=A0A0A9H1Q4_ARUDO
MPSAPTNHLPIVHDQLVRWCVLGYCFIKFCDMYDD